MPPLQRVGSVRKRTLQGQPPLGARLPRRPGQLCTGVYCKLLSAANLQRPPSRRQVGSHRARPRVVLRIRSEFQPHGEGQSAVTLCWRRDRANSCAGASYDWSCQYQEFNSVRPSSRQRQAGDLQVVNSPDLTQVSTVGLDWRPSLAIEGHPLAEHPRTRHDATGTGVSSDRKNGSHTAALSHTDPGRDCRGSALRHASTGRRRGVTRICQRTPTSVARASRSQQQCRLPRRLAVGPDGRCAP